MYTLFKGGPGIAVRQQRGGHRWEGTALALRAGGGYGTEEQADWVRQGGQGGEPKHTHNHSTVFRAQDRDTWLRIKKGVLRHNY